MNKEDKEKWIIDLLNEGVSIRRIAKKLKMGQNINTPF